MLVTARQIPDGNEAAWHQCWKNLAERLDAAATDALRAGHRVSAQDALLRASNYYRAAEFYPQDHPVNDPEVTLLSGRVRDTFADAASLFDPPAEALTIPFEGTSLPGYLFRPAGPIAPRPTLIYHGSATRSWKWPTSWRGPRPSGAVTPASPSTVPAKARCCATRASPSGPTGRTSSARSSTPRCSRPSPRYAVTIRRDARPARVSADRSVPRTRARRTDAVNAASEGNREHSGHALWQSRQPGPRDVT